MALALLTTGAGHGDLGQGRSSDRVSMAVQGKVVAFMVVVVVVRQVRLLVSHLATVKANS